MSIESLVVLAHFHQPGAGSKLALSGFVESLKILRDPGDADRIGIAQRPAAERGKSGSHDHSKIDIFRVFDDEFFETHRCLVDHQENHALLKLLLGEAGLASLRPQFQHRGIGVRMVALMVGIKSLATLPALDLGVKQEADEPLRALLALLEQTFSAVHENIEALYHDLFIETCDPWAIPYIADLLGTSHLAGDPATIRRDVAGTIGWRRRRGTLGAMRSPIDAVPSATVGKIMLVLADVNACRHQSPTAARSFCQTMKITVSVVRFRPWAPVSAVPSGATTASQPATL